MNKTLSKITAGGGLIAALLGTNDLAQAQSTKTAIPKSAGIEQRLKNPNALYRDAYQNIAKMREGLSENGYNSIYADLDRIGNEARSAYLSTNDSSFLAVQVVADMFAAWTERTAAFKGRNVPEHLKKAEDKYKRALDARIELKKYDPMQVIFHGNGARIRVATEDYIRENLNDTSKALTPYRK